MKHALHCQRGAGKYERAQPDAGQHTGSCMNFKEGKGSTAAAYAEHDFPGYHERVL